MIAALHILMGIITPHLGTIVSSIVSLLKSKEVSKEHTAKDEDAVKLAQIKAKVEANRLAHNKPVWSDKVTAVVRAVVVLGILSLFSYEEIFSEGLSDEWWQGVVSFVIAHVLSSGFGKLP